MPNAEAIREELARLERMGDPVARSAGSPPVTNAQVALMAACSVVAAGSRLKVEEHHAEVILDMADAFKGWLDNQDALGRVQLNTNPKETT